MEWHSGSVIPFLPFSRGGCAEPVLAAERTEATGEAEVVQAPRTNSQLVGAPRVL